MSEVNYQITEQDIQLFKNFRECGMSLSQIRRMLPYSKKISDYIIETLKKQYPKISKIQLILEDCENGMTTKELAEKYNVTRSYIQEVVYRTHKTGKKKEYKKSELTLAIIEDIKSGLTNREICQKYGVTRQCVSIVKKRHMGDKNE